MIKKIGLIMTALVIMVSFSACSTRRVVATEPLDFETGTAQDEDKGVIINAEPVVNDEIVVNDETENDNEDDNEDVTVDDGNEEAVVEETVVEEADNVVEPAEPENKERRITLYYTNKEYIMTGDAALDSIVPVNRSVMPGDTSIEEVIVAELQKQPGDENLDTSLDGLNILTVDIAEKTAYVNISSENLNGGSLTESLVLQQLVYSLTELDGVEAVQILVDGSKQESLMGHITIQEPLTRADIQ